MLKSKRSSKDPFCIPDIYNPFYFGMIKGASDVLERHGYFTVLCHTRHRVEEELRLLQYLRERYGDGMILVSFNFNRRNIDAINVCGMPVVLTNRYDSRGGGYRFDYVYIDTRKGISMATRHLLSAGHRRVAYLGGFPTEQTGAECLAGDRDAMEEAGVPSESGLVMNSDETRAGGYEAGRLLLAAESRPSAVVAANDLMAIRFMQACEAAGVSIPADVSVVGMDNTDPATFVKPRLSPVMMREEDIGSNAATLYIQRILGGRTIRKTIRLEPGLVVRESSGGRGNQYPEFSLHWSLAGVWCV